MPEPTGPTEGKVAALLVGFVVGIAAGAIGYGLADVIGMVVGFCVGDAVAMYLWLAIQR